MHLILVWFNLELKLTVRQSALYLQDVINTAFQDDISSHVCYLATYVLPKVNFNIKCEDFIQYFPL